MRRAALTALAGRLAAEPAEGLEAHVARAGLDRRRQVLLLRTIRDLREPRAASYLFAAAASSDGRVANEALGAMYVTRTQLIAWRHLWAGVEEPVGVLLRAGGCRQDDDGGEACAPPRSWPTSPVRSATTSRWRSRTRLADDDAATAASAGTRSHGSTCGRSRAISFRCSRVRIRRRCSSRRRPRLAETEGAVGADARRVSGARSPRRPERDGDLDRRSSPTPSCAGAAGCAHGRPADGAEGGGLGAGEARSEPRPRLPCARRRDGS
jgi:hypothetical protein